MKKILPLLFLSVLVFSCKKQKCYEENLTYYSSDYKEKNVTILGVNSSSIDALWVEFYSEGKSKEYNKYTLIVKANGDFHKETGTCAIDWKNQITFNPNNGSSYTGIWVSKKDKYKLQFSPGDNMDDIYFIYKKTHKNK